MDLGPGGTRQHATAQGKTKSEDLARLCNNQRRSRARRQEYVHHLERRVREYEESSAAREEQSQLALQKLRADNDAQKQRLDALSINRRHDRVESELTPNVFDTPGLWLPMTLNPSGTSELHGTTSPSCCSQETVYTFSANDVDLLAPAVNHSSLIDSYRGHQPVQTNDVMQHRDSGTLDTTGSSATLCSLAYKWVTRCYQRGIDLHVISMWMQHGFQPGRSPTDGCRVDNRVLLAALTRIS